MRDTLSFVTSPDETEDEIRIKEVKTLKMGLMRYVAKTPLAKYMQISFSEPLSETVSSDKWDSWVIRTSILLRRKELETQYRYFTFFGFTYTFGSIYNNVVNPRFGNNGGGGMTIMMN